MGITYPAMELDQKSIIHTACRRVLRPLVSMLLRCGMTWREFSDLSKTVFVQAATEEFGIKGRPTNVSRVSILTGIGRKEIKRQRDLIESDQPRVMQKTTDATRLLSGWHQDTRFLNRNLMPKMLPEKGQGSTFETLFGKYGGDIAMPTMIKELIKTGAMERHESGDLRVLMRYYQPALHDDENLLWASSLIRDLVVTMNNNVFKESDAALRFARKAENVRVSQDDIPAFRELLNERGQSFLEEIDDWLTQHEQTDVGGLDGAVRLGVSIFTIQDIENRGD